jgi:hypothetical protein
LTLPLLADPDECLTFDEECAILNRSAAIADNEARAFEPAGGARAALCARNQHGREHKDERARQKSSA